jgi:hypothetical protein
MRVSTVIAGFIFCMASGLMGSPSAWATADQDTGPQAGPCAAAISVAERARNIPVHLLQAISLTESGRWSADNDAFVAWPWTVMAEGKGRYLPSKEAAIAEVQALKAKGITNIDVGCMQVNLYYHGSNFDTLSEAFDPVHNVAYATAFLMDLRHKRNSWSRAVKEYHSTNRQRQQAYQDRVMTMWDALKKGRPIAGKETGIAEVGLTYMSNAQWPPKNYHQQQQLEAAIRGRVMSGSGQF